MSSVNSHGHGRAINAILMYKFAIRHIIKLFGTVVQGANVCSADRKSGFESPQFHKVAKALRGEGTPLTLRFGS